MKKFLAAVALCLFLVVSGGLPALAAEPQENPDNAAVVYDGLVLLQKYSRVLDGVLAGDAAGVLQLQDQAVFANLPPELDTAIGNFFASAVSLASLLPPLQEDLDDANTLLAQYRVADAGAVLDSIRLELTQAYSGLLAMNVSASDTARRWQADTAPAGSPLRQAYDDVQVKLRQLHELLDFRYNLHSSLKQTETGIILRSANLSSNSSFQPANPSSNSSFLPINPSSNYSFQPTSLSLVLEPEKAFVGEKIMLSGVLSANGRPLEGRIVTLLLDNVPVASKLTNSGGTYRAEITVPFKYVPIIKVQAVYYPIGNDIGAYLGVSSNVAGLSVLFYEAKLNVSQGTPANPGRDFLAQGAFNYGNNTALPERLLNVYLDDNRIFEGAAGTGFFLRLSVAADTSTGTHRLIFDAPADGRYAPARAAIDVEVSRILPGVELDVPTVVLLPFPQQIRGNVRSSIGPLADTAVEIALGNWKTAARTGDDGSFSVRLDTGLSLTFLGAQDLRVTVNPAEPWYRSVSSTVPVMVINPVNIAGIMIILLALAIPGFRRLGRKAARPARLGEQPAPILGPVLIKPALVPDPQSPVLPGDPRSVLLSLYRGILRFVQQITGMILPPDKTLREFAAENEPKLGPAGGYFREFTLMIERLLYSRHDFDERDVAHARELNGKLRKGADSENS